MIEDVGPNHRARVVVVTGAGNGIGREIAIAFAADGDAVVVNDLSALDAQRTADVIVESGGRAVFHQGDVSDEQGVRSLVGVVRDWAGRADVLVNNAGMSDRVIPTAMQETEDWHRVLNVNLTSAYLCSREFATAFMIPARDGRIINLASLAGVVGLPMRNAYSAAKAGIVMMTRTLGSEWAGKGITVNAIAPGYMRTNMTDRLIAEGKLDEQLLVDRIPAGHLGTAGDIANAAKFLAAPASSYITGVTLPVDGGWCAYGQAGPAVFD